METAWGVVISGFLLLAFTYVATSGGWPNRVLFVIIRAAPWLFYTMGGLLIVIGVALIVFERDLDARAQQERERRRKRKEL